MRFRHAGKSTRPLPSQADWLDGINLLELCFPNTNWGEYARRGFRIKRHPYRLPYNYEYAGGLPIAGSEETCLRLLRFASETNLRMGVHYCSLENKFTSQFYLQNSPYRDAFDDYVMSQRDYLLKTVRLFGADARRARTGLDAAGIKFADDQDNDVVTLNPRQASALSAAMPEAEVAICSCVVERRGQATVLRELGVVCANLGSFSFIEDI